MSEPSLKKEPINIVITFDEKYSFGAGVMLNSVLQNTKRQLRIYILHPGLADNTKNDFERLVSQYGGQASVEFMLVASELLDSMRVVEYLSTVTFYRLLIPDMLPSSARRAIYLDPDIIVETDIGEMWDLDLGGYAFGAVFAPSIYHIEGVVEKGEKWFNGGVLLMELDVWRRNDLTRKCIDQCEIHRDIVTHDQVMMHVALPDQSRELPARWNKDTVYYYRQRSVLIRLFAKSLREQPGIIHFTGTIKPWDYACYHPGRSLFYRYMKGSPWEARELNGRSLISMLVRWIPFKMALFISMRIGPSKLYSTLRRMLLKG